MTPVQKEPTYIVFQGASMVELDRRLHAAGVDTARVEIRIPGVKIPKNTPVYIRVVAAAVPGEVVALDHEDDVNDSHTHPPY